MSKRIDCHTCWALPSVHDSFDGDGSPAYHDDFGRCGDCVDGFCYVCERCESEEINSDKRFCGYCSQREYLTEQMMAAIGDARKIGHTTSSAHYYQVLLSICRRAGLDYGELDVPADAQRWQAIDDNMRQASKAIGAANDTLRKAAANEGE